MVHNSPVPLGTTCFGGVLTSYIGCGIGDLTGGDFSGEVGAEFLEPALLSESEISQTHANTMQVRGNTRQTNSNVNLYTSEKIMHWFKRANDLIKSYKDTFLMTVKSMLWDIYKIRAA